MVNPDPSADRLQRNLRDLSRWRVIFAVAFLIVPLGLYALFERQARRLDALGDHGRTTTATIISVHRRGSSTYAEYEYRVGAKAYTWSVGRDEAPGAVGSTLPATYLPEDPSLSRPGADRQRGPAEARKNRAFSSKLVGVLALLFGACAFACDFKLRKLRSRGLAELDDPRAVRDRLMFAGALLLPLLALISWWHAKDALARGESVVPVVLGVALTLGVIAGTVWYLLRRGVARVESRRARLLAWAQPILLGVAALRLLAWLLGWQ